MILYYLYSTKNLEICYQSKIFNTHLCFYINNKSQINPMSFPKEKLEICNFLSKMEIRTSLLEHIYSQNEDLQFSTWIFFSKKEKLLEFDTKNSRSHPTKRIYERWKEMGLLAMEGKGRRRWRMGIGVERSMKWSEEKRERFWWKMRWDGIILNPIILPSTILSHVDGINFFMGLIYPIPQQSQTQERD